MTKGLFYFLVKGFSLLNALNYIHHYVETLSQFVNDSGQKNMSNYSITKSYLFRLAVKIKAPLRVQFLLTLGGGKSKKLQLY